ncbi:MAG: hypothetical protein ACRELC_13520, partial [Gemmatimonadota bacterium]
MEERRLEKQQASPWPGGRSTDAADSLPSEVVRDASRRLGWAGLVYSLTYFFAYFGVHFVGVGTHALPAHRMLLARPVPTVVAVASLALG